MNLFIPLVVAVMPHLASADAPCECTTDTECVQLCGGDGNPDPVCSNAEVQEYIDHLMSDPEEACAYDKANGHSVHDWDGDVCAETDEGCPHE